MGERVSLCFPFDQRGVDRFRVCHERRAKPAVDCRKEFATVEFYADLYGRCTVVVRQTPYAIASGSVSHSLAVAGGLALDTPVYPPLLAISA